MRVASVVKVRVAGGPDKAPQPPNAVGPDENRFVGVGALVPPYDPLVLSTMYEESSALRPNVEAYAANIEGFEHHLEPTLDLEANDAREKLRDAIMLEKLFDGEVPTVTDEEIDTKMVEVQSVARLERLFVDSWFDACCSDLSFTELRERTRIDLEVTGNAYWEVTRNQSGQIAQLEHVVSTMVRLMPLERTRVEVSTLRRVSALSVRRLQRTKRFRTYVQMVDGTEAVFFKELGDPRVLSSRTGRRFASAEELMATEGAPPATELIHFRIYSPLSAYGVPRWIGATPAVLGTRAAEEINVLYFEDKCIPPMALYVEGATLEDGALDRIEEMLKARIKGRENFHSLVLLEAGLVTMSGPTGDQSFLPKIRLEPLTQFQQQDALFQNYEANNAEKVGQQFRLPRILRGQMTDFNRATSESALEYVEQQVFQPARHKVDHVINNKILAELQVRFWTFVSGAPVVRNPPALAKMIFDMVQSNVITLKEARELIVDVFGRNFDAIDEEWTQGPVARLTNQQSPAADAVREIMALRAGLETAEAGRQETPAEAAAGHAQATSLVEVLEIPSDEFRALFRPAG